MHCQPRRRAAWPSVLDSRLQANALIECRLNMPPGIRPDKRRLHLGISGFVSNRRGPWRQRIGARWPACVCCGRSRQALDWRYGEVSTDKFSEYARVWEAVRGARRKGSRRWFDCAGAKSPACSALAKIVAWKSTDPTGRRRLGFAFPGFRPLCGLHPGLFSALPPGANGEGAALDFRCLWWSEGVCVRARFEAGPAPLSRKSLPGNRPTLRGGDGWGSELSQGSVRCADCTLGYSRRSLRERMVHERLP